MSPHSRDAISCLPPELLAEIFRHLARDAWGGPLDPFARSDRFFETWPQDDYGWIRVTHVCQLWRIIALETAGLWARINTQNQDFVRQCLVRSRQHTSLDVAIVAQGFDTSLTDTIVPDLHRIRRLKLFGYSRAGLRLAWDKLAPSVANLTDLNITRLWISNDYGRDGFVLPNGNFKGSRLRRLVLSHIHFRLDNPIFVSSITHLALFPLAHDSMMEFRDVGTCTELLSVLQRMPDLETLILSCVVKLPATDVPTCTFARLRRLCLFSLAEECAVFLSHISFPSTATVAVHIKYHRFAPDVPALVPAIVPCLAQPMQSATLVIDPARLRLRGSLSKFPPAARIVKPDGDPTMSFPPSYDEDIPFDLLVEGFEWRMPLLGAIGQHLPAVRHLCIQTGYDSNRDPVGPETWEELFASFPITDTQRPFPSLDILELVTLHIFEHPAERAWDDVCDWLEQRFHHNIPVREVRAKSSPVWGTDRESIVEEVRKYVETVEWDQDSWH